MSYVKGISDTSYNHETVPIDARVRDLYVDRDFFAPSFSGSTGPTGPQGIPGATGPQGIPGATGPQGIPGVTGPQGIQGLTGPTGSSGIVSISNNGGSAEIGQNITAGVLNLRTIRPGGSVSAVQTLNTIDISAPILTLSNAAGSGSSLISTSFPNATLKLLVAGTNTTLNNASNTVTISSPNLTNTPDAGAQVYAGLISGTHQFKTLQGGDGITISSSPTALSLNYTGILPLNNTVDYNFGQDVNIDLSLSYTSTDPISSNTITFIPEGGGEIFQTSPTTATYRPGPRENYPTSIYFTTTSTTGLTNNSIVKLQPNLSVAYDSLRDFILGCDSVTGRVWQINMDTFAERPMVGYDGNPLPIDTAQYIAMDIDDAVLFFHIETDPFIRVYDFVTGNVEKLIEITGIPGFSGILRGMCFNNITHTLYFIDDNSTLYSTSIPPYNRILTPIIPYGTILTYPFTISGHSPINITTDDSTNTLIITYSVSGVTQITQVSAINSYPPSVVNFNTLEASSTIYSLTFGASGRLYVNSLVSDRMYRYNYGFAITNAPAVHFSPTVNKYYCLTRSPYGIQA